MAGPVRERVTAADRRHFDFAETLLRISDELTEEETADVKLFCRHLIPKSQAVQLRRAVDVFNELIELDKIDQENLDFIEEILERIGRPDLIRDILRPFQPPDREIPENPELQPENPELPLKNQGTSHKEASANGNGTSDTYVVVQGQMRMVQETLDRLRNDLARLSGTSRSQVKFRGYKKDESFLVHFSIPRESAALLRHMAQHSDPRLVYMGVKSLQIDAEVPIKVQQEELLCGNKRQMPVDDIEVGCSTRTKQQRAPESWTRLSALNLFSDALSLHLQAAASLEYQGFSYGLIRALVQNYQLREHKMRQLIQNLRNAEKAAKQDGQVEKTDAATQTHLADAADTTGSSGDVSDQFGEESPANEDNEAARQGSDGGSDGREAVFGTEATKGGQHIAGVEEAASPFTWDLKQGVITFGGKGSEPGMFQYPRGVLVSPRNEIFVTDKGNRRVQVHSTGGVYIRHFPTVVPGTEDNDMEPHDICMDANGTLWVVGVGEIAHHVVQYGTDGTTMKRFDLPMNKYNLSRSIAVDMRTNHILVTDDYRGEVQVFRPDGSAERTVRRQEGKMTGVGCIAVDGKGNLLVTDWSINSIYVFDESGDFLFKFGGKGSGEGQLKDPRGICTDTSGHIIVADRRNRRVQIFTRNGEYVRAINVGSEIQGLAVGPQGQLVVTSWRDNTVSVFHNY
ncbi:TRIM3 [Branchiostoma lanceolatum]|uniref:TRIM3 protein n=1 Tax=Branchiostoma lanceolatum TaxID=7740 RepID=A0A8K0F1Y9_BRALA|nr:TRIM3 [Branchiostoma lanceolatum]